jgi:hypothetical protein
MLSLALIARTRRSTRLGPVPGAVWLGVRFVLLGLLHFIERDHTPETRSYYVGGIHLRYRTRVLLALVEVAGGFVVLFALR